MRHSILVQISPPRRRWPWWAQRAVLVRYFAFVAVTSSLIVAGGYWLMHLVVAWRMGL